MSHNWLTPKQVAGICGVSIQFLTARRSLRLPPAFYRLGGKILYDKTEIDAWIARARVEPNGD